MSSRAAAGLSVREVDYCVPFGRGAYDLRKWNDRSAGRSGAPGGCGLREGQQ